MLMRVVLYIRNDRHKFPKDAIEQVRKNHKREEDFVGRIMDADTVTQGFFNKIKDHNCFPIPINQTKI